MDINIDEIIENFLKSGVGDLINNWTKNIQIWAEKSLDEDLIEIATEFVEWRDIEELKSVISIMSNSEKIYFKSKNLISQKSQIKLDD